jgi:TatD DNase family protein
LDGEDGATSLLGRAAAAGVSRVLAVGGEPGANATSVAVAHAFPGQIRAAVGLDRDQAAACPDAAALERAARSIAETVAAARSVVAAIGEVGLDFHYHPETQALQRPLLERLLALARELVLPVVVHCREAEADVLAALRRHRSLWPGDPARIGVLHCFTGTAEFAAELLALDYHLSFSGIVTFRNADRLRGIARGVRADRLLVETDTPFLAPMPVRGRPNEPAFLRYVVAELARVRGETPESVGGVTARNASRLFGWSEG